MNNVKALEALKMLEMHDYANAGRTAEEAGSYRIAMLAYAEGGMHSEIRRLVDSALSGQIPSEHILDEATARLFSDAGLREERASVYEGIGIAKRDASYLQRAFDVYRDLGRNGLGEYRREVEGLIHGPMNSRVVDKARMLVEVDSEQPIGANVFAAVAAIRMYHKSTNPDFVRTAKEYIDRAYDMAGELERDVAIMPHKGPIDEIHKTLFEN